jgi:NTE family protein
MGLNTVIQANLLRPTRPVTALVLMGGGARTAYQVGVLRALASIMLAQVKPAGATPKTFPFQVLVLAHRLAPSMRHFWPAVLHKASGFRAIGRVLGTPPVADVYRLNVPSWVRVSKFVASPGACHDMPTKQRRDSRQPAIGRHPANACHCRASTKACASRTLEALA